jgi:hypothetical protein
MVERKPLDVPAGPALVPPEIEQAADALDREAEVAGPFDKAQHKDVRLRVDTIAAGAAMGGPDQARRFVIAEITATWSRFWRLGGSRRSTSAGKTLERAFATEIKTAKVEFACQIADSDEVARAFRDDVARGYEMMSPELGASLACVFLALDRCRSSVPDCVSVASISAGRNDGGQFVEVEFDDRL